jgi:hypothetical protein
MARRSIAVSYDVNTRKLYNEEGGALGTDTFPYIRL